MGLLDNPAWLEDANGVLIEESYIHKLLEDVEITKPEHVDYYMNPKTIINLINGADLVF